MFAVGFLGVFRGGEAPDVLHLFTAVDLAHERVVEAVLTLGVFGGPEDGLGGVGEVAAGEVGRRVGFFPGDLVQEFHAELLHGVADGKDNVVGAADPEGAVGLEDALAAAEPFEVELVVELGAAGFVPGALVHFYHFAGVAGDAAVGEEVGRVGEDAVEAAFGVFDGDGVEEFEAVAVVEPKAAVVVTVHEARRAGWKRRGSLDGGIGVFGGGLGIVDKIVVCV